MDSVAPASKRKEVKQSMKKKGLCADAYAKVWKIYPREKVIDLQVSIQNKMGDSYKKTFSGFIKCTDKAFEKAQNDLNPGDTIQITCEPFVTTSFYNNTNYTNFWITDFKIVRSENKTDNADSTTNSDENGFMNIPDGIEENIPFE